MYETGANDVLRLHHMDQEGKEMLIPFIEGIIIKVDLELSQIIVDWDIDY